MMSALMLLIICSLPCGISELPNIHYVRTTDSPPSACPDQPCLTLYQYAQLINFTDGTVFSLLPGTHSLQNLTLILANVSNVTIRGEPETHINCESAVTLLCQNVTDLQIEGLNFLFNCCGKQDAINLIECDNVIISYATFQGSENMQVTAPRAIYSRHSIVKITQCAFILNKRAAVYACGGTNLTICGSNFTRNRGRGKGGAIGAEYRSSVLLNGSPPNVFTHNFDALWGGAIYCSLCTLDIRGFNTFHNCSVLDEQLLKVPYPRMGGAIYIQKGKLNVSGVMHISYSKASLGGAIYMEDSHTFFNGQDVIFQGNSARLYGGAIKIEHTSIVMANKNLTFIDNTATFGGAIYIANYIGLDERVLLSGYFVNNTGKGGAVYANSALINFTDISMMNNSRSAVSVYNSNITFNGTTSITENQEGAITAENSVLVFKDNSVFSNNRGANGGAIYCLQGAIFLSGHTLFTQNSADTDGGALYAVGTTIYMKEYVAFAFNTAGRNGGGVYLDKGAIMTLKRPNIKQYTRTLVNISNNLAQKYGGGIYVTDNPTVEQCKYYYNKSLKLPFCFIQAEIYNTVNRRIIKLYSHNNRAGREVNFLYGGLLDRCEIKYLDLDTGLKLINEITSKANKEFKIESKTYDLCVCKSRNCKKTLNIEVHRGQVFTIPLMARAQMTTTSTTVSAITSSTARLEIYQTSQNLKKYCHSLPYTLYSAKSTEQVTLYPDGLCDASLASVVVNATLLPCPDGFTQSAEVCICDERLHHFDVNCTIDDIPYFTKAAASNFWIDVLYANTTSQGLILSSSCPAEYCKTSAVNITLDNTDIQCDLNRSGLLCGACAVNYSLMLGGSQCKICHNTYLALLLPLAAAGIALVIFLAFLRLTLAIGSLNSVVLYANIIQVNRKLFLPVNTRNVLTVFLAWMNLDLGFQTCFYNGLDAYVQTWLQFVFPLYVWLLIGVIILISRYSITVSRLVGHNPIAVFATLILMSYTKILKIIIEVYSSSELEYPDNKTVTVWLKDANVPYLQSRHLLLTVVTSMILVFFFLPYTLLLLLGHQLYHFSGRRYFGWFRRMKPFLDSYYAPYKVPTRYWTGFLLIVRCTLYAVFMFNSLSTHKSLLAIILTFTVVIFTMGIVYSGRIYQKFHDNVIEGCVYVNLIVLSATTLAGLNSAALAYSLIALAFILMIAISTYQFFTLYIIKTALWVWLNERRAHLKREHQDSTDVTHIIETTHDADKIVTKTFVELREPLIEN